MYPRDTLLNEMYVEELLSKVADEFSLDKASRLLYALAQCVQFVCCLFCCLFVPDHFLQPAMRSPCAVEAVTAHLTERLARCLGW